MSKITEMTIKALSEALKEGEITSVEIIEAYLDRIKKVDSEINAFLALNEKALEEAKNSDGRRKKNQSLSELDGIPVSVKDVISTKGITTTASSKMLKKFVPTEDATVVKRLKKAGMIILGKNNCDAWAHGSSTENSDFGPSRNPYDPKRTPGGSSGGSAAAVAAGEVPLSIGTDTGGSIRQPAGFCGVVGLKPTYGLCSRYGLIAMASSLDCPGPMTKDVYDNALILSKIAGSDSKDAMSAGAKKKDYLSGIEKKIRGLKIGIPEEYFSEGISQRVKNKVLEAIEDLRGLGAEIVNVSLPNTKYGIATYYIIQPAEVSSNLGRYDGIKYGYASKDSKNLVDHYFKSRSGGFGREAKRRIMLGTYVLSAGYYEAYYKKAMQIRTLIKKDFENVFKKCDVIIGPTSPTVAFKFGERVDNPLSMYLEDAYTVNANLAGIPSLAVSCGQTKLKDGKESRSLPVGIQIMGPWFGEELLYQVGRAIEKA